MGLYLEESSRAQREPCDLKWRDNRKEVGNKETLTDTNKSVHRHWKEKLEKSFNRTGRRQELGAPQNRGDDFPKGPTPPPQGLNGTSMTIDRETVALLRNNPKVTITEQSRTGRMEIYPEPPFAVPSPCGFISAPRKGRKKTRNEFPAQSYLCPFSESRSS